VKEAILKRRMRSCDLVRAYDKNIRTFHNVDLSGENLSEINLSGADFTGSDFTNCHLRGTNFTDAVCKQVNFDHVDAGLPKHKQFLLNSLIFAFIFLIGIAGGAGGIFIDKVASSEIIKKYFPFILFLFLFLEIVSFYLIREGFEVAENTKWQSSAFRRRAFSVLTVFFGISITLLIISLKFAISEILGLFWLTFTSAVLFIGLAFALTLFLAGIAGIVAAPVILGMASFGVMLVSGIAISIALDTRLINEQASLMITVPFSACTSLPSTYILNRALNGDSRFKWLRDISIRLPTYFGSTSFRGACLEAASFQNAYLPNVDFRNANLLHTIWYRAKKLNVSRLEKTILQNGAILDLLVSGQGAYKIFDNLSMVGANLQNASLYSASLVNVDFSDADLRGAILTDACIKDWNINSATQLDNVQCEYVYMDRHKQDRRPSSDSFKPGEFTKLFQVFSNTVDLIFRNGVDWQAFTYALETVKHEKEGAEIVVQSIENKRDGVVVVKLGVSSESNKTTIHSAFMQGYRFASEILESKYQSELIDTTTKLAYKNAQIVRYSEENRYQLEHINKLFSLLQQKTEVEKLMMETPKYDMRGSNFGNFADTVQSDGKQQNIQHIYAPELKQSLIEAAQEIQNLLKQLEATNPQATEEQQMNYVNSAIPPTLKQRTIAALKEGGETAINEFLMENKYLKVGKSIVKGWLQPDG